MENLFAWDKVKYPNEAGLMLSGLLYAGRPGGTIIVVCHGFTGSKEGGGRALAMAEELGQRGYATLLFDFSGCGESEGDFVDVCLTRHIGDVRCSVEFCRSLGFDRVITVGRSFGGSAAICLGRFGGRVAGICTWAAPGALNELFTRLRVQANGGEERDLIRLSEDEDTLLIKKSFLEDLDRHNPFNQAARIAPCPFLIIHGSNDQVVPPENAWSFYHAAGEPKKIHIIPRADHQFTGHHTQVWEVFFAWLAEYFA